MCGRYFHDLSRSQATARIYSIYEPWKKFRCSLEIFRLQVYKKVLGAFSRFMRPKMKLFAVTLRRILEVFVLQGLWRRFWAHFHDLCFQKWSCFLRSSDAFRKFSSCKVYKKILGALLRFMRPKMKLFAINLRRILEVFALRGLWRKFWSHFHDSFVQKWSCFVRSSDAFCKFSPCEVYEESSKRIITIYVSENEAVS